MIKAKLHFSLFLMLMFATPLLLSTSSVSCSETKIIHANADIYVTSNEGDRNYGGQSHFYVGRYYSGEPIETYFKFTWDSIPDNIISVNFVFYAYNMPYTMKVYCCLILTNWDWDEYEITWNTKPGNDETIGYWLMATSSFYSLNVTDIISSSSGEIGFRLFTKTYDTGYCVGYTRECGMNYYIPCLEITYIPNTSGDWTLAIASLVGMIGLLTGVIIYWWKNKRI